MSEAVTVWYVLFQNHTQGLKLNKLLNEAGIKNTIVPTPRKLSVSCGISLMLDQEDVGRAREVIDAHGATVLAIAPLERDIDPGRDRYC